MQTKLTLRLDQKAVQRAKRYGKRNHRSLSKIVADYFLALENAIAPEEHWSPLVRSLKGALAGKKFSRTDVLRHLEKKYL